MNQALIAALLAVSAVSCVRPTTYTVGGRSFLLPPDASVKADELVRLDPRTEGLTARCEFWARTSANHRGGPLAEWTSAKELQACEAASREEAAKPKPETEETKALRAQRREEEAAARAKAAEVRANKDAATIEKARQGCEEGIARDPGGHVRWMSCRMVARHDCSVGDMERCLAAAMKFRDADRHRDAEKLFAVACKKGDENACEEEKTAREAADAAEAQEMAARRRERAARGPIAPGDYASTKSVGAAFKADCERGDTTKCTLAGWKNACDAGDSEGCVKLATAYLKQSAGLPLDSRMIEEFALRGCVLDASVCLGWGGMYAKGVPGLAPDAKSAATFFDQACRGNTSKCADVGNVYRNGVGVVYSDSSKAAEYFKVGCDAGSQVACEMQRRGM